MGAGCLNGGDIVAFEGWIIKFGETILPVTYIAPASYDVSPEKRKVIDDWTDNNGKMHYDIFQARKVDVEFTTKLGLNQKEVEDIQKILASGLLNEHEGRYDITIWNPHNSTYKRIEAKADDVRYPMRKVDSVRKDIIYDGIKFRFREY